MFIIYDRGIGRVYSVVAFLLKAQVDPSHASIVYARNVYVNSFFTMHKRQ